MGDGQITRKDIITDEALRWGDEYAKTMEMAIGKNKEFADSIILLNAENVKLRRSENQTEFIKQKNEVKLLTEQSLSLLKEQTAAELSLEKIKKTSIDTLKAEEALKQAKLKTDKQTITNQQQLEKAQKSQNASSAENTRITKLQVIANQALAGSYEKIQAQLSLNTIKWKKLSEEERNNTKEGKALTKEILNQETALKKLDSQLGKSQRNVGNYGSAFKSIGNSAGSLLNAFGIVGGVTAIAAITTDIFKQTKELQSLDLALQTVTETSANFGEQQQFLRRISLAYGADINSLTASFTQFYASAKDKLAGKDIQNIFESVTKAGGVLGLSVERQEKAFLALNQMMSKGTVQAEELRGQLAEALPNSMGIMKNAVQELNPGMIITEKTLGEMMKSGKLLSAEVLPEFAKQMQIAYGIENVTRVETLAASQNRLTNKYKDFIRSLNESDPGPVTAFFKFFIDTATNALNVLVRLNSSWDQLNDKAKLKGTDLGKESFDKQLSSRKAIGGDFMSDAEYSKVIKDQAVKELKILREQETNLNKEIAEFNPYAINLGKSGKEMKKEREQLILDIAARARIIKEANNKIQGTSEKVSSKNNAPGTAETPEQKTAREKAAKDKLDLEKQLSNALYELQKQRLEQSIKLNQDIVSDETKTDEIRIQAAYASQTKQEDLIKLTKNHLLNNDKLVANDRIRINEDASNKIIDINEKTSAEIEKINQFDSKQYQDNLNEGVKKNEIAMNDELAAENERFAKLGDLEAMAQIDREKAVEDHERNIFNIKKEFALATAKLQLANLEAELKAYELQSDGSAKSQQFILEKRKQISEFSLKITELGVDNFKEGEVEKTKTAKEQTEEILQVSSDMTGALSDLSNAFSEAKIQKIDEEINKNNEYYDKQIELAGNDIRQKELLEKERDKKNEVLEKKKRAAQHKQAVFDKAVTVAQIAIQTALAIIKAAAATAPTFWGVAIAATLGAIELGAALATPIPKYKMGRKGGPAEFAIVGDGGVPEVVTGPGGSNPRLTPNIPTLTHLGQGDIVHSSIDSYEKSMRASILASLAVDRNKMNEFHANQIFENDNKEVVKELQLTRKAIEKNKTNVTVNVPKVDINHEIWKMKNKNWNQ